LPARVVAYAPPPQVPVTARTALAARVINAQVPFADAPTRRAPPFLFGGSLEDRARATDCLAAAAYYEAGTDAVGQRAVIQVVLNRVRNPAYPHSVCGVVFQGAERSTGCQFTFTCDGSMARRRPTPPAWQRAQLAASAALDGYAEGAVGHATHYHTDWVHPYWSRSLDKVAVVSTHLFFQYGAHRPGNFSARYAGTEPRIGRLATLSIAHTDTATPISPLLPPLQTDFVPRLAALPALVPSVASGERLPDQSQAPGEGVFLVALDTVASPDSFRQLAERLCAGQEPCKVLGWSDPQKKPARYPIPGSAIDAISFSFHRAGAGAADRTQWNCREFPRSSATECLYLTQ
jgi:spore germination cell wall hydrolase CwlJ-like protein